MMTKNWNQMYFVFLGRVHRTKNCISPLPDFDFDLHFQNGRNAADARRYTFFFKNTVGTSPFGCRRLSLPVALSVNSRRIKCRIIYSRYYLPIKGSTVRKELLPPKKRKYKNKIRDDEKDVAPFRNKSKLSSFLSSPTTHKRRDPSPNRKEDRETVRESALSLPFCLSFLGRQQKEERQEQPKTALAFGKVEKETDRPVIKTSALEVLSFFDGYVATYVLSDFV